MAHTKQTAGKNTGGKPLAMGRGRGKGNPKSDPKPGGRVDRKVVLEYSSDENLDEDNPQSVEGAGALKRVKKQIHLTLPTSPAHVTTTETFTTFFINHGLTKALRKAFEKRGWSTDQIREFITNFQQKHGKKVLLPKLYGDEDSSDNEGMELADGTTVGKKTTEQVQAVLWQGQTTQEASSQQQCQYKWRQRQCMRRWQCQYKWWRRHRYRRRQQRRRVQRQ